MNKQEHYLFDLSKEFLDTLELLSFDESTSVASVIPSDDTPNDSQDTPVTQVKNTDECSTCALKFDASVAKTDKIKHYKSDLHRLNLKRAVNGLPPLKESEFEELLETQSMESISGSEDSDSDSESDEGNAMSTIFEKLSTTQDEETESNVSHMHTKSPFLLLKSSLLDQDKAFGVYKSVFDNDALSSGRIVPSLRKFNEESSRKGISVILMIGGGHFAGAVISHQAANIKGNAKNQKESIRMQKVTVVESKTFHRYTTRRKQGGSQSASDNAHGKANSAGSSIRRYNEQALQKDIRDLLQSWKTHINAAEHVFIRASGAASRKILVGYEGAPLSSQDKRVKSIPFTTKRATLSEVKSAWTKLTYLSAFDIPKTKPKAEKPVKASTPSKSPEPVQLPVSDIHTRELISLLKKSKAPLMINYLRKNTLDVNMALTPDVQYGHTPTLLHAASAQGLHHMVKVLMVNLKADPTMKNINGKTAYALASTQQTKHTFQICRGLLGEEYCNWSDAKVGPPKTSEEVAEIEAQEKQEQAREQKRLMEEALAAQPEPEEVKPRGDHGKRLGGVVSSVPETSGLSDAQKMAVMREQRARAAEARMKKN